MLQRATGRRGHRLLSQGCTGGASPPCSIPSATRVGRYAAFTGRVAPAHHPCRSEKRPARLADLPATASASPRNRPLRRLIPAPSQPLSPLLYFILPNAQATSGLRNRRAQTASRRARPITCARFPRATTACRKRTPARRRQASSHQGPALPSHPDTPRPSPRRMAPLRL